MVVCPTLTTWKRGRERRAEGREEVRPSLLLVGGEVGRWYHDQNRVKTSNPGEGVNW